MVGLDIDKEGIGYKKIRIQPHVGGKFTDASASYETQYGTLSSGWKIENGQLMLHAEVPANTTATIYIPASAAADVLENGQPLALVRELQVVGKEKEYVVVKVGSGKYEFSTAYKAKQ